MCGGPFIAPFNLLEMGRFAHFVEKLSSPDPVERLKQIQEVCDKAGPRTYKKEEGECLEDLLLHVTPWGSPKP